MQETVGTEAGISLVCERNGKKARSRVGDGNREVTGQVGSGPIVRASRVRVRNSCTSLTVKENQLSNLDRPRRTRKRVRELRTGGKAEKSRGRKTGRR